MTLSENEQIYLKKINDLEGKLMGFIQNNSAIVSFKNLVNNNMFDAVHIDLIEIFSSNKYPIGQSLKVNISKIEDIFSIDEEGSQLFNNYINTTGIILVLLGHNYDNKKVRYIWSGEGKIPWEIGNSIISKRLLSYTKTKKDHLVKVIEKIKYIPYNLDKIEKAKKNYLEY